MTSERPTQADWTARRRWFAETVTRALDDAAAQPGQQAEALLAELEDVFCVGAWLSAVILSTAVIEAHLRETAAPGNALENTRDLFHRLGLPAEFEELRLLRNRLVHVQPGSPTLTPDMHWSHGEVFEQDARDALRLVALALTR
ncbi:hypothetical protein [Fodinicurvata sp. EGI_FJ10296]|uniref:hypothetical protein n=1 Tax=Fodinicurvata sp. EGI_FJ10296 TaxID=3231908 RepID=UPI003457111D